MSPLRKICLHLKNDGLRKTFRLYSAVIYKKLYDKIISVFKRLFIKLPLKNSVVFECESDMDDNPRAFYEYLLEIGWNRKNKLVWLVNDAVYLKNNYREKNVVFIDKNNYGLFNCLIREYYLCTSKYFIFSHFFWFEKKRKDQIVVNVWHGTPIKGLARETLPKLYERFDVLLVPTEYTKEKYVKFLSREEDSSHIYDKILYCGAPRLDMLKRENRNEILSELFEYENRDVVIICMPTYKQSVSRTDSRTKDTFSIDVVDDQGQFLELNEFLKKNKVHLIIKPHPLQIKDGLYIKDASNIHYIDNRILLEKKIIFYELLGYCDALLTDVSSVYYDYLLLDRPIGILSRNFDEYGRGFIDLNALDDIAGEHINSLSDLLLFISEVKQGIDPYLQKRQEISRRFNYIPKESNSKDLADWLFNRGK